MIDELKATYFNKNPLARWYFRKKVALAINLADLRKDDVVLDFGCGAGWLKNILRERGLNVTGFDKTKEYSDIKDYTKLKPSKIFALDVFEHIPEEKIKKIITNFKKMNPNFGLIVSIPTENWISRKARRLLGKTERVANHITTKKQILKIFNSELNLVKKRNFLTVSYIAKFNGKRYN